MRKLIVIAAMCCLVAATAACSSSSKPTTASTTTVAGPKLSAADQAQLCASFSQFESAAKNVGDTPTTFQAAAAKFRTLATQLTTTAPPSLATAAQAQADLFNTAASQLSAAKSRSDAVKAIAALIFVNHDKAKPYMSWWTSTCQK